MTRNKTNLKELIKKNSQYKPRPILPINHYYLVSFIEYGSIPNHLNIIYSNINIAFQKAIEWLNELDNFFPNQFIIETFQIDDLKYKNIYYLFIGRENNSLFSQDIGRIDFLTEESRDEFKNSLDKDVYKTFDKMVYIEGVF